MSAAIDTGLVPVEASVPRRSRLPWYRRVMDGVSHYLPLVLMALLALATWRLAQNTPVFEGAKPKAALQHVPDYTMHQFTVKRFSKDGALTLQIEGDTLRHFPDTDTLEVDKARIRSVTPEGRVTRAWAASAVSNGDGSEIQLSGDAHVLREAFSADGRTEAQVHFRSEFLHAFMRTEQVRSHVPVLLVRDTTEVRGDSMHYDNLTRLAQFSGRVRATFEPKSATPRGAAATDTGAP